MPQLTAEQLADREELQKASHRIGRSPKAWMQWILKFAQTELGELSAGGWMDLGYEVALFTLIGPPEAWQLGRSIASPTQWGHTHGSPWLCVLPKQDQMTTFHALANQHLEGLIKSGRTEFPPFQATITVSQDKELDSGILELSPQTIQQSFLYGLARLLAIHATRIRRCPSCQKRFVANRRDQRFCSTRCLSRTTMRKYRGTPTERFGKPGRPRRKSAGLSGRAQLRGHKRKEGH